MPYLDPDVAVENPARFHMMMMDSLRQVLEINNLWDCISDCTPWVHADVAKQYVNAVIDASSHLDHEHKLWQYFTKREDGLLVPTPTEDPGAERVVDFDGKHTRTIPPLKQKDKKERDAAAKKRAKKRAPPHPAASDN